MTLKDLRDSFKDLMIGTFRVWFDCVRKPLITCEDILSYRREKEKLTKVFGLWLAAFQIALILQFPVYKLFGIDWTDLGFHLPNFLVTTSFFLLAGTALHVGLRIFGIRSNFVDTSAMYTTLIGCYSPLFVPLSFPATVGLLSAIKSAKAQNLDFVSLVQTVWEKLGGTGEMSFLHVYGSLVGQLAAIFTFALTALLAAIVCRKYAADRYQTFSAIGFSMSVLSPAFLAAPLELYYFLVYVFVK